MADRFSVEVVADFPNISFDLWLYGRSYTVCMEGGHWQLRHEGGMRQLVRGSVHWTEALRLAIEAHDKEYPQP